MNIERLDLIIEIVRQVSDPHVELFNWVTFNAKAIPRYFDLELNCGTVACAAGWACLDTRVNALGLNVFVREATDEMYGQPMYNDPYNPQAQRLFNFDALTAFLEDENTPSRAASIFMPNRRIDDDGLTDKEFWLKRVAEIRQDYLEHK